MKGNKKGERAKEEGFNERRMKGRSRQGGRVEVGRGGL